MADVSKLLGSFFGSGFAGGMAGGLVSSMVTTKSGRKMGKKALKLGGVAAVGALAYTAYKRYGDNQAATQTAPQGNQETAFERSFVSPAVTHQENPSVAQQVPPQAEATAQSLMAVPAGSAFMPEENDQAANDALGLTLIRAMIAVARADGRLDAQESQAIFQKIEELGLDSESQTLLIQEMGHPVDMDAIVNSAKNSPEVAAEIYVASLLAVDVDTPAEKAYLAMLAARLQLPTELVAEIENQVETQKQFA